jgi:hypothetical protein
VRSIGESSVPPALMARMDAMPIFFFNATGVRQWDCRRLLSSTRRAAFDRRMHRPGTDDFSSIPWEVGLFRAMCTAKLP